MIKFPSRPQRLFNQNKLTLCFNVTAGALGRTLLAIHSLLMAFLAAGMKDSLLGLQLCIGKILVVAAGTSYLVDVFHCTDILVGQGLVFSIMVTLATGNS